MSQYSYFQQESEYVPPKVTKSRSPGEKLSVLNPCESKFQKTNLISSGTKRSKDKNQPTVQQADQVQALRFSL
jgi:hypothetical protein